jgi:hypothetical protein
MADYEFKSEVSAWVMIPKSRNKGTEVTLDMRPLVLCKDCKHYKDGICLFTMRRYGLRDDWFCADGERQEGR